MKIISENNNMPELYGKYSCNLMKHCIEELKGNELNEELKKEIFHRLFLKFKKEISSNKATLVNNELFFSSEYDPFELIIREISTEAVKWCINWGIIPRICTKVIGADTDMIHTTAIMGQRIDSCDKEKPGCPESLLAIRELMIYKEEGYRNFLDIGIPTNYDASIRCISIASEYTDEILISPLSGWEALDNGDRHYRQEIFMSLLSEISKALSHGTQLLGSHTPKIFLARKWAELTGIPYNKIQIPLRGKKNIITQRICN